MSGTLRPIDLVSQPAPYPERYKILQKLVVLLQKVRPNAAGGASKLAIGLEGRVAKTSSSSQSYRFNMSVLFRDLSKHKGDLTKIRIAQKPIVSASRASQGNISKAAVMEKLKALLHENSVLEKNGYIMRNVTSESAKNALLGAHETCARCNTKFERASIMKKTLCRYHDSKKQFDKVTKSYQYPCCGESTASTSFLRLGCKTHKHHVFKPETAEALSDISEFIKTSKIRGEENVLALDCEMGFTSLGYEMIRLTIVDFFTSKTLFDEIVQPLGEVVDLNTQFSGVSEIDKQSSLTFQETMARVLSPKLINANSILIGHGLENDLNVMRIVHQKIIDTAILYSTGRYKNSLKNLAFEFLSRKIQTGEHDSSEDAIATMDVLKVKNGIPIDQKTWD
ncbi:hypothetical protein HG536_0C01580 [Torulaspora globosa]|uniref:RNA exonuclease 3 n=1 Tax=Torulaspora globosa TaxID=48254 RepID=A0A7G3ZEQ4_9SACH|nr:uncharacterized protein HG536_0C01580 [Torulaspora globosa]QLL31990.1 hypothetical protein HG536_0C01580 [Torulaspora globosa]